MATATRNPVRSKAKRLLGRFMNYIEKHTGEGDDPDKIPDLSNSQWRTMSAVLATYRMMVDEHYMEQEAELAKLDYTKLTLEELEYIRVTYAEHPLLPGANGGKTAELEAPGNGSRA